MATDRVSTFRGGVSTAGKTATARKTTSRKTTTSTQRTYRGAGFFHPEEEVRTTYKPMTGVAATVMAEELEPEPIITPAPIITTAPLVRGRDMRTFETEPLPSKFTASIRTSTGFTLEEAYSPEFAGAERATYEHTLQLLEETPGGGMVQREAVVDKLEAEGIDRGKAWDIVRRAELYEKSPEKFEKKFDAKVGDPFKPYESEKILQSIRDRHTDLLKTKSELGAEMGGIYREGFNIALRTWEKGDPYGQKASAGGAWFNISKEAKIRYGTLRQQLEFLDTQISAIGSQFETSGKISLGNVRLLKPKKTLTTETLADLKTFTSPEAHKMVTREGSLDIMAAIQDNYTDKELKGFGFSQSSINQARALTNLKYGDVVSRVVSSPDISVTDIARSPGGGRYTSGPSCIGDVCVSAGGIMSLEFTTGTIGRAVPKFAPSGALAGTRIAGYTQPVGAESFGGFTYQGIAGKDVGLYDRSTPFRVEGKAVPAPKFAPGGFLAGQGLRPPLGQELMLEAMTSGQAVTYLRDTDLMKREFAEYSSVDRESVLGQFTSDLNVKWNKMKAESPDSLEKAAWMESQSSLYDTEANKAREQGVTLTESKSDYLAGASTSYDTQVFSGAAKKEWVAENLASYEKDLDIQASSGVITLTGDAGKVVFHGSFSDYKTYRTRQSPTLREAGKGFGISMIPVYGTIKYGQQAAIGGWTWGERGMMAASIAGDIAMIVPPSGMAARAALPGRAGITTGMASVIFKTAT